MKKQRNYFVINKRSDYEKSAFENMEYDSDGFFIGDKSVRNRGVYLSRVLDSREREMEWHRFTVKISHADSSPYKIKIYTAEEPAVSWKGEQILLKTLIQDQQVSMEDKLACMEPYLGLEATGKPDLLLHEVKGRYLWFSIEVYQQNEQQLRFEEITAYFPKQSWLSYLPELYEASDSEHFLDRYLSVFQSIYDDMNQQIKDIPYLLDVQTADSEYLDFLCQWIGITKSQMWKEEKKRLLLSKAAKLFQMRGTRAGILEVLQMYLDKKEVFLVEKYFWNRYRLSSSRRQLFETLYGTSSYTISVLVKDEDVGSPKEYKTLFQVLDSMKPAQADLNLVVLKPSIVLDGHSYLGINSTLCSYQRASLDGKSVMSFAVIGSTQQKERLEDEEYETVSP